MYDLVAVDVGERAVIVDWKTSRRRPSRAWLAERQQTRVYPYVLVHAGEELNGGRPLSPEQVRMLYWFADYPADPETFLYDAAQYEQDEDHLVSLVEEIAGLDEASFALTSNEALCRFCPYRSLCQRGAQAGDISEAQDEAEQTEAQELFLDFEQIAEIEY
jgi:RecB family exonuclease